MQRWALFLCSAALAGMTAPAGSTASEFADELAELRQQDHQLQAIGWKLLTGNAHLCSKTTRATGLLLQDAGAYANPAAIRSALGLKGDFFVQSVVAGSPANEAQVTSGMEVSAIDGGALAPLPLSQKAPWLRLQNVDRQITASLAADGAVELTLGHGDKGPVTLGSTDICDSYFELISGNTSASTNGRRVAVGRGFVGFDYPEGEFAAALSHELAHNFLDHREWLDRNGRKRKQTRITEDEADRLMPWLLANAGYDPEAGVRFMERWGPKNGGGLFRKRTHSGWDERAEAIAAEIPLIRASQADTGTANWKSDFKRSTVLN